MLAMPAEEMDKLQNADSAEKSEELDAEFEELASFYDKVVRRLKINTLG